jgi:pterin-4a-carbinolamine dehydratase
MLGRRVLTWHLAGMRAELRGSSIKAGISYEDYHAQWGALARFAALVEAAAAHPDDSAGNGLVKVQRQYEGVIEVDAELRDQTILSFRLEEYPPDAWWQTYQSASYKCRDGGLVILSYFLPPDAENPAGLSENYSTATFYRAIDGSLVMLEESPVGITNEYTSPFQKWWRWQKKSE